MHITILICFGVADMFQTVNEADKILEIVAGKIGKNQIELEFDNFIRIFLVDFISYKVPAIYRFGSLMIFSLLIGWALNTIFVDFFQSHHKLVLCGQMYFKTWCLHHEGIQLC